MEINEQSIVFTPEPVTITGVAEWKCDSTVQDYNSSSLCDLDDAEQLLPMDSLAEILEAFYEKDWKVMKKLRKEFEDGFT